MSESTEKGDWGSALAVVYSDFWGGMQGQSRENCLWYSICYSPPDLCVYRNWGFHTALSIWWNPKLSSKTLLPSVLIKHQSLSKFLPIPLPDRVSDSYRVENDPQLWLLLSPCPQCWDCSWFMEDDDELSHTYQGSTLQSVQSQACSRRFILTNFPR